MLFHAREFLLWDWGIILVTRVTRLSGFDQCPCFMPSLEDMDLEYVEVVHAFDLQSIEWDSILLLICCMDQNKNIFQGESGSLIL